MEITTAVQVKVSFNEELRRFSLLRDATFKQLSDNITMICSIDPNLPIVIKYMDSEKDMVTMSSDAEFREALKSAQEGILRLSVAIKTLPSVPSTPAYPSLEGELEDLTVRTEGTSLNPAAPQFYPHWGGPHRGGFPHAFGGPRGGFPHAFGMGGPHRGGPHHRGHPHPHPYGGPHHPHHGPHAHPHEDDFMHQRAPWKEHKKEMKEYIKHMSKEDREKFKEHRKEMKLRWKEMKGKGEFQGKCSGAESSKLVARHVKDVTITDGTEFLPNTPFVKTWKLRNEGEAWPTGCCLMFISRKGDRMGGPDSVLLDAPVPSGQEVDISVNLIAPSEPGRYTSFYRLVTPDGVKFGQRMWVSIVVTGSSSSSSDDEAKYAPVADMIEAMGFHCKRKHIVRLLVKHDNDVDKVVKVLAKKDKALCGKH